MKNYNFLSNIEIKKLYEETQNYRVKCKCGHSCTILNPKGYKLCSWCHNYVFINSKVEFEFRMKQKLLEERRNRNEV